MKQKSNNHAKSALSTKTIGEQSEKRASTHYNKLGFEIVEENYRHKRGEIDLIVLKDQLLVFVEVKYRSNAKFGNPEDFVSPKQSKLIIETADQYIHDIKWKYNLRFDIIAIDGKNELMHFEDAFY